MLVIISDLHLTDGTSGETIRTGAFRTFRERIRDLAYDASWRSDERYAPIECVDLVLLGDIIDVIRSSRWSEETPSLRPWGDHTSPGFADMVARITEDAIANNRASLDVLRSLHDPKVMNVPPAGGAPTPAVPPVPSGPGDFTFRLLDAFNYNPEPHNGHKVRVIGYMVRLGAEIRVNVQALQMVGASCGI